MIRTRFPSWDMPHSQMDDFPLLVSWLRSSSQKVRLILARQEVGGLIV